MEGTPAPVTQETDKIRRDIIDGSSRLTREDIEACSDRNTLVIMRSNLENCIRKNEEKLRKLILVQKHNSKNSPSQLDALTEKWLTVSQQSLQALYDKLPDKNECDFPRLLNSLGIDPRTIQYDLISDSFY